MEHTLLRFVRFEGYRVDLQTGELRKNGTKIRLSGQPFQILAFLLEKPGELITREELRARLWPDEVFVDFDHSLNAAVNKLREALCDSTSEARFVETLPKRGYRFIAPIEVQDEPAAHQSPAISPEPLLPDPGQDRKLRGNVTSARVSITTPVTHLPRPRRRHALRLSILCGACVLLASAGFLVYKGRHAPALPRQRTLTRLTFDDGLQIGATWSPDGRFIAYSSDRERRIRHLGATGQRRRSRSNHKGTRSPLATGLVTRWKIHCLSF